jgi:hypothetical protein
MGLKINIKDITQAATAQETDFVLVASGSAGNARLVPVSEVAGPTGATGILLTCPDNGFTYQVSAINVEGTAQFRLTKVSAQGQFVSFFNEGDGKNYELKVRIVNGYPTLVPEEIVP